MCYDYSVTLARSTSSLNAQSSRYTPTSPDLHIFMLLCWFLFYPMPLPGASSNCNHSQIVIISTLPDRDGYSKTPYTRGSRLMDLVA